MKLVGFEVNALHFFITHGASCWYLRRSSRQVTFKPFAVVVAAMRLTMVS